MAVIDVVQTDGIGIGPALARIFRSTFPVLADSLGIDDGEGPDAGPIAQRLIPVVEDETVAFASAISYITGIIVRERLVLTDNQTRVSHRQNIYLVDVLQLADTLRSLYPATIADSIRVASTLAVGQSVQLAETLGLAGVLSGAGRYNLRLVQSIRLADSLAKFFGAEVDDGIALTSTMLVNKLAAAVVAEGIGIADLLTPRLLLNVVLDEDIELDDTQIINMLFRPTLEDGIEINAGYLAPDGSLTTWAMNARTGAVTEYDNYEFNSFARVGNRYIGAAEDGLYELLGNADGATSIVARLQSGYMQFGGTRLSRLNAAYIAARGEGAFVLRIITGDGAVYNYATSTRNMRSTKVHMGKGQRARYFAFELISAGQDFDLDTLEFVPIVVKRRV